MNDSDLRKKPEYDTVVVTPELAKKWLMKNVSNRALTKGTVAIYAGSMAAGDWKLSGSPIIFDQDGNLIDGQHRLHGCIKANVSFETTVAYNIANDAYEVLDNGQKRSAADILTQKSISPDIAKHATAAAYFCIPFQMNKTTGFSIERRYLVSSQRRAHWVLRNKRILEIAEIVCELYVRSSFSFAPRSHLCFLWFFMEQKNFDMTHSFFEGVIKKINLSDRDPRLVLINKADLNAASSRKLGREAKWGCIIRAWDWYCRGKEVTYAGNIFRDLSSAINLLK
jgi:hypothetical protein